MPQFGEILFESASPTKGLARAVAESSLKDVPVDICERLKHSLLDWLGVAIAGSRKAEVSQLCALYEFSSPGGSTVLQQGYSANPEVAAFLNAFAGHILDFDDVVVELNGHPSAVVVPAVLSMAEAGHVSGEKLLDALHVGFETICWLGLLFGDRHYRAGWHATSILGTIGATAGVAKLLEFDEVSTERALGLAGSLASGIQGAFGSTGKPFQVGNAAGSAVRAATCTMQGLQGPLVILERPGGLLQTHSAVYTSFHSLEDYYGQSLIRQIILKKHASCFGTHAAIEAIGKLNIPNECRGGLEKLEIRVSPQLYRACNIDRPISGDEIKFSLRTVAALAFLGHDTSDLNTYSMKTVENDQVKAIADCVEINLISSFASSYCEVLAKVSGMPVVQSVADSNVPLADLSIQEKMVASKFSILCEDILSDDSCQAVARIVGNLSELKNTSEITDHVRGSLKN